MIACELERRRPKRVLEVGCFRGGSTRTFLRALRYGWIKELHLCEPHPTPELLEMRGAATLHECPSVELALNEYDLVCLDGDHSLENCLREAVLLDGVSMLFAHDTCYAQGPKALADCFRADKRYQWWEDSARRPGERTERGLFFAWRIDGTSGTDD